MQPQAARDFYTLQQAVSTTAANEARRAWRRHMGDDFDASWRRVRPTVLAVLTEGQRQMASAAADYVPLSLNQTDLKDRPQGELRPGSLVGLASDGRRLDTLADQAVVQSKLAIRDGAEVGQALDEGGDWLHMMTALQVADAARVAVGIGVATRTDLSGYVRCLNPPVCQRCAVLGGRVYRWSTGFDRHPRDDCTMVPVKNARWAEAEGFLLDPKKALRDGHIHDLTDAQKQAIAEGAELQDVVNAYRGMSTTATQRPVRSSASQRAKNEAARQASIAQGHPDLLGFLPTETLATDPIARLTPEGIYRLAGNDRGEAIRLLRREGYIT